MRFVVSATELYTQLIMPVILVTVAIVTVSFRIPEAMQDAVDRVLREHAMACRDSAADQLDRSPA